jgi:hypothetical protein
MYGETHLLLFSCSAQELGWTGLERGSDEVREHVEFFLNAAVADICDHLSLEPSCKVLLYERGKTLTEIRPPVSSSVVLRTRSSSTLRADISEAVRDIYVEKANATVIILFGRNPLYPPDLLLKGADLLAQKDDVVMIGQAMEQKENVAPMWISMKCYHPELLEMGGGRWRYDEFFLQLMKETQSLVMPMRAVRDARSVEDLPVMLHDIEREILLKKWFPHRTYEVLKRMQRLGILPEAQ